jgi:hypothetical protein
MPNMAGNANAGTDQGPQGQPGAGDPQAQIGDMFDQISNEALPEVDPQNGGQGNQASDEPGNHDPEEDGGNSDPDPDVDADDDIDDDDDLGDGDGQSDDGLEQHSAAELRQMVIDSQKQIGTLANRVGELTATLTNAAKKPEVPPQHVALANASPEEIEAQLKLPEGVSGVQVKLMASMVQAALSHELKRFEPMLNDFSEMKSDLSTQEQLLAKYGDLPKYAATIKNILVKRYPNGVPIDKRGNEIESVYLKLKKREKAEALAHGQNAQQRQQVRNASGARKGTPPQQKKSPDFFDSLNSGID